MQARSATPQRDHDGVGAAQLHEIGSVPVQTLAAAYGTPLLAFDLDVFDRNVARFEALGRELGIDVSYAAKAFFVVALARRLARTALGLDVCSLGELMTAERAAFPASRLTMHGCAKSDGELRAAAAGRVGRLVIDNHSEIERLADYARPQHPLRVLLRVNTGIEAQTHAYVRTGGEASKFGLLPEAVPAALAVVQVAPGLRFAGFHSHLGSQLFDAAPYRASLDVLLDLCQIPASQEADEPQLVIGGGFGVGAPEGDERIDIAAVLHELAQRCREGARKRDIRPPRLGVEPGRAIVAEAGTSLYGVAVVKRQGPRRFVIVDGGMADNPRPALYGAFHEPSLVGRRTSAALDQTTLCGRSCENDQLAVAPLPLDLQPGDLLAMATTGAYTFSMASNYNRFPRPAVVFVQNGTHQLAVRRETERDVMRNDVDDDPTQRS